MKPETPRPPLSQGCSWLVAGILGAGGLALLAAGLFSWVPAQRSNSWPAASGVITGHRIESIHQQKSLHSDYKVGVTYTFKAGQNWIRGQDFSHSTVALPMSFDSREAAESAYQSAPYFQEWQVGRAVTVYYDPLHPENAVLKKGASRLGLAVTLLGAFLSFGAIWEWYKIRRRPAIS